MKAIAAVILVALGMLGAGPAWAKSLSDGATPDSALFTTVAGKWGWKDNETSGCAANPHTVAFPDDKTMTITFAKSFKSVTGVETNVVTYDVLYAEDNRITAYLRGETRRTEAGDRVVWVLILKNPNTYAWRRTDWKADSMTKEIERCR